MKTINFIAQIKGDKLSIYEKDKFDVAIAVGSDGRYWGTLEKIYSRRSNQQNRSWYALPYKILAINFSDATGEHWTENDVHEFCKNPENNIIPLDYIERIKKGWKDNPKNTIVSPQTGEIIQMPFKPTTTKMTTVEGMEYYRNMQDFAKAWFNVDIPDPDPEFAKN
jgi:hypothetical protein